ncbi:MAG TPA: helix-turn-helix domain-containing protein [Thermoguttaceae bacterium]|nr:helix-turn-helix domain-containing protein [Thermoguttaceae bacterium]
MKTATRMSGAERREAIIAVARQLFVEKGFHRTTTRELADQAGISEALLFKHFASKEDLYRAIQISFFEREGQSVAEQIEALEPSTTSLVSAVECLVSRILSEEGSEERRSFIRLVLRSLMDEGEFARLAVQGGPCRWVHKIADCLRAARAAGDMVASPVSDGLGAWCTHHLITGMVMHLLPDEPLIDYGLPREELLRQVTWFCLRGLGLKDESLRRYRRFEQEREKP